jgi:hypothetical protein
MRITLKLVEKEIENIENDQFMKYSQGSGVTVKNLEKCWLDDEEDQNYICQVILYFDMDQRSETYYAVKYDRKMIDERIRKCDLEKK